MAAFFRELLLVLALLVCIFSGRLPLYSCQSSNDTQWQSATNGATWYGAPDGDGSDGKKCTFSPAGRDHEQQSRCQWSSVFGHKL